MPASLPRWIDAGRDDWTPPPAETCKALARDLARAKVSLERGLAAAGDSFVGAMLGRVAVAQRLKPEEAADWAARVGEYLRLLGHYPADLWWQAADEWLLGKKWFPFITELNDAMFPEYRRRKLALERVEAMMTLAGGDTARELEGPAVAVWRAARERLIDLVGERAFKAWLSGLLPLYDDGEELVLGTPTQFMAERVKEDFGEAIADACGRRVTIYQDQRAARAAAKAQGGFRGRGW